MSGLIRGISGLLAVQGSFSKGTFAAYNVYEREVELSEVPIDEPEGG